ncbi:MAG: hypothetical protein K0A93_13520, partial [Desulfuromonadaceae bacterium]|nr:hypothetical protein [Desulfuromonadaceae bacterium]
PTNADCEKCHDESSGPDGTIQLKVWNADNTTFTTATYSSADLSSANTHCVSCHDDTRGVTISGLSAPARSMANYTSATTYNNHNFNGATYGTAIVPTKAKAISPHGNPGGNQLKGTESSVTTAMGCLHCHPSHGSGTASKTATADAVGTAVAARMLGGLPSSLAGVGYDYDSEGALSDPALCWGCHDNKGVADYYGDTTTGHWNGGTWKSPSFEYKTGKGGVSVLHIADKVDGGTASDAAASIVCTTCHDVHGSPTVAQFYSPALKGMWLTSPYYEDRTPPSYAGQPVGLFNWPNANSTARGANTAFSPRAEPSNGATTWVPKEIGGGYGIVGTQNGAWGYFIDANTFGMDKWATESAGTLPVQQYFYNRDAANFNSTSMTNFAGLCMTACHSQANIDTRTSNWSGHKATVPGFGGSTTVRDLFNITPAANQLASGRDSMGKHYYNNTGYGQDLFALTARLGGDSGATDSKEYAHNKSVSWGVTVASTTATTQTGYHQFPCSKCHNPHASELPALMRTNCLDVKHSGYEYRMADEAFNCHRVEQATPTLGVDAFGGDDTYNGIGNGQQWNTVTPW